MIFLDFKDAHLETRYVELDALRATSDSIPKSKLYNKHQSQLSQGTTNEQNMKQLLEVFGGIDDILSHYLSPESNIDLSQTQLNQINAIISNGLSMNNGVTDMEIPILSILSFSETNTLSYKILNPTNATKLANFIYHKIPTSLVTISTFIVFIWFMIINCNDNYSTDNKYWDQFIAYRLPWSILILIYLSFALLTINIKAFILSIKQFIFWFKIFSCIKYAIFGMLLDIYFNFGTTIFISRQMSMQQLQHFIILMFLSVLYLCVVWTVSMYRGDLRLHQVSEFHWYLLDILHLLFYHHQKKIIQSLKLRVAYHCRFIHYMQMP